MAGIIARSSFFVIFVASICYVEIFSKDLYILIPNTQTCKVLDPTIVHNVSCKSKNVNRTLNLGSREAFYQPGVSLTNFHRLTLHRKFATIYRQFMIDIHIDLCALYAGNESVITPHLNTEMRRKYGNFYNPCPISGKRYEYNVPLEYSKWPEILPAGEYRFDAIHYTYVNGKRKHLILTQNFGEIKTTTAEQWKK